MEPMDFRKLNAARVVICPALDVSAGVVSGSMEYIVYPSMSGEVPTERYGELPELSDGVKDADLFFRALDRAIQSYVDWSARFAYLKKLAGMFRETGFRFMPSHPYKVIMWIDSLDDEGYVFSFLPLRESGKVSSDTVPEAAHSVHVTFASLEEGV
jgi:hypothetical protein